MQHSLHFKKNLPARRAFPKETVLLFDSILLKNQKFKKWSSLFNFRIPLPAGESLKNLNRLEVVANQISALKVPQTTQLTFIAVGGGSVGDFVGFLASIFLRGRKLIHIPSTWLAAVDSAHGGKNALNLGSKKNQFGTFYPASEIYIIDSLLKTQPKERLFESMGEIIKTAIINDANLFSYLEQNANHLSEKKITPKLRQIILNKYKIIKHDPFEKNGKRRVLNLGHTMGHVFESHYGWPHGICVILGILFSTRWSYQLKLIDSKNYIRILYLIEQIFPMHQLTEDLKAIPHKKYEELLLKDKKQVANQVIDFIFIKKIGSVVRKKVKLNEILREVKRQSLP